MHTLRYAENHTKSNGWFHRTEPILFDIQKIKSVSICLTSSHDGFLSKQMRRVGLHVRVLGNINGLL